MIYIKKQYGGDLKEDAIQVLKDNGYTAGDNATALPINDYVLNKITRELGCEGEKEIDNYKFKHNGGFYNGTLRVKRKSENDSKYVEIFYSGVCSQ